MRSFRLPLLNPAGRRDCAVPTLAPNAFDPSRLQGLILHLRADRETYSRTAVLLDGVDQYLGLDADDSADFDMGSGDFTIAMWVYPTSVGVTHYLMSRYSNTFGTRAFRFYIAVNNAVYFELSDDGTNLTVAKQGVDLVSADHWYFLVSRYDGSEISIRMYDTTSYMNEATTSHTTGMFSGSTKNILIGSKSNPPDLPFDGRIDSVGVWKGRALTDSECDTLWNSGNGKAYADLASGEKTNLLAWWDMNEATGTRFDSHDGYDLAASNAPTIDDGVAEGAAGNLHSISRWGDLSSEGNDARRTFVSLRPARHDGVIAGKPVVRFDGLDDMLEVNPLSLGTGPFLIAWVEGYSSGVSRLLSDDAVADDFIRHDSATSLTVGRPTAITSQVTHADISGGLHISMLTRESDGTLTYYLDGTSQSLGNFPANWNFDRVGELQGDLAELAIIAGRNLADSQRNQLGRFFARKYALTWSSS